MAKQEGPEKQFENRLKEIISERGGWFVKYWGGGYFTRKGVPDLLCCYRGRFLAIEVKAENGKVSAEQTQEIAKIKNSGGIALVLRPSNESIFFDFLNMIDSGKL